MAEKTITIDALLAIPEIKAYIAQHFGAITILPPQPKPARSTAQPLEPELPAVGTAMETESAFSSSNSSSSSSESEDSPNEGSFIEVRSRKRSKRTKNIKEAPSKTPKIKQTDSATTSAAAPPATTATAAPAPPVVSQAALIAAPPPTDSNTVAPPTVKKSLAPPPLYIRDKEKWLAISAWLNTNRISYKSAKSTPQGIRVDLHSSADHRSVSKMLGNQQIPYHTYTLPEAKLLRAVIRNVPREIETKEILESLKTQDLPVVEVHRMIRGRGRYPLNMILVCLTNNAEGKGIFKIKTICGLSGVSVEPPHKNGNLAQCHKCQLYGHSSKNCFARPRCVKCLGDHHTSQCERPKDISLCKEPPACVLCGEYGHPANYRGCPRAPRRLVRQPNTNGKALYYNKTFVPAPLPTHNAWARPLLNSKEAFPTLPNRQPAAPPATSQLKPPTTGPNQPTGGNPKPPQGAPIPIVVAKSAPPKAPQGLDPDLALVANFAAQINFTEIREIAADLRRNEGNNLALLNTAIKFSPTLERLGSLKFK